MLYYKLIPKTCRANTSLENYNRYLKENLDYKKSVEWINLLNFLKNEEVRITNNLINDEKNFTNSINDNYKQNINNINLNEIEENISLLNINEVNWIKWKFNSCRYDSFIILYITTFEKYLRDKLSDCNILINSLNKVALELIQDPGAYSRFEFWKECDNYGLDVPNKFTSLYLKEGYISGLFTIYNNNDDFCIKTNITYQCFKCGFYNEKKNIYSKCLINLTEELLNFNSLNNIISYKYQFSLTTCDECINKNLSDKQDKYKNIIDKTIGDYIKTLGINYDNITLPNFLIFIMDIDYNVLKKEDIQKKLINLLSEETNINSTLYNLKNIIFMPSSNHYNIDIFNIEENLLLKNIDITNFYYYDDLSGVIIEKSNNELKDFIEVHFGYIYIYSKV